MMRTTEALLRLPIITVTKHGTLLDSERWGDYSEKVERKVVRSLSEMDVRFTKEKTRRLQHPSELKYEGKIKVFIATRMS